MNSEKCMIESLKQLRKSGVTELEIYYAEIIEDPRIWSVDVMNNHLNNVCEMAWTWTVISSEEDKIYREEFDDDAPLAEYEIVVHDEDFSDEVVCKAIESWLVVNDLDYLGFTVKMVDVDTTEYSGYVRDLDEMDIDDILAEAKPFKLEDLDDW